jgi:hypothetical protein
VPQTEVCDLISDGEPIGEPASFSRFKGLIERGYFISVEIIADYNDFYRLGIVMIEKLLNLLIPLLRCVLGLCIDPKPTG